jgi:hypothetical protein
VVNRLQLAEVVFFLPLPIVLLALAPPPLSPPSLFSPKLSDDVRPMDSPRLSTPDVTRPWPMEFLLRHASGCTRLCVPRAFQHLNTLFGRPLGRSHHAFALFPDLATRLRPSVARRAVR